MYAHFFKRILDLFVSLCALVIFSPIIIITFVVLYYQNKGKVFFFQERPGMNQKPFNIIKFKSMTDEKDENGNLLPDIERITKFGAIVRKLSIDELPQLINVLKGDMSLVGPRPLLFKYIPLYSEEQLRRHEVRPGITGWAQVNGWRGETDTIYKMQKRVELDMEYIHRWSLGLDIKIIFVTAFKTLYDKNAY